MKEDMSIRKDILSSLAILLLALPLCVQAQSSDTAAQHKTPLNASPSNSADSIIRKDINDNAAKARAAVDAMVQALGGQAWIDIKNSMRHGHIATFYQGKPNLGTTEFFEFHQWPDKDRSEYTKYRDVVQFYLDRTGLEVTYRGKKPLPQDQVDEYLRRRDHSIETVIKTWLKDPSTILIYEGQHLAERHLADQVTIISVQNEAVTILMDAQTHLPLRRSFQWRDPLYKDKNTDAEEYDDYHVMDGFPTPLTVTRYKNDEMIRQIYVDRAQYNQALTSDFWDVDATASRITQKKKK